MKQIIWALLALSLLSCAKESEKDCGFVQNSSGERISWKNELPVRMRIHESVPVEYRDAVYSAASKWNNLIGYELIRIDGVTSGSNQSQKDGANIIYMNSSWESDKASEQARTAVYWVGNKIVETDIRLNGQNFSYYWANSSVKQGVNIEALVLHEMGHVLGLKHKENSKTVMQTYLANNTDRTQVGSEDLESLKCEY
jgi:predicted Zn-dependent protease